MAKKDNKTLKIFSLNRIRYDELWADARDWIKQTYNASNEEFTMASPFALLLSVILHLGRMIFYYIEDSITGLNIKTAYRPDLIKGLATLTGHTASRSTSARGAIRITYVNTGDVNLNGNVAYIPNKIKIVSTITGATYIVLFGADNAKLTMNAGNYIDANIIQGKIKYQLATGSGDPLQSFNFSERNYAEIELYFINVYVNSELWPQVNSLLDLGFAQKGVMIKTGLTGGIDIFFGNGVMGAIPPMGSTILVEYIISDGAAGNIGKEFANSEQYWEFLEEGYLASGLSLNLNTNFKISCLTDIIFGSEAEDVVMTQLIAPHTSRSMVLANETNYLYFFKRMNMFSHIEIIKGYNKQLSNHIAKITYDLANIAYHNAIESWKYIVGIYGENSKEAKEQYEEMNNALIKRNKALNILEDTNMGDNTIYILLIPDIKKRISKNSNYFICDESLFTLSTDEQINIINLIDSTKQKIISVENKIVSPKIVRFAVNAQVKIWEDADIQVIYSSCLQKLSDYFLSLDRKDLIPSSDIVAIFEEVNGIDSVKVWFDADKRNAEIYDEEEFYGIDQYGDIVLTRTLQDYNGNVKQIRDMLPLFRGGFISPDGVEYSAIQSFEHISAFNISVISYSTNRKLSLENYTSIT